MKSHSEEICRRSHCAINIALETVGDKWSLLILRDLMFSDKRSYGELQASEEKIATNILASRLLSLEQNGIIRKTTDPANGRRSLYFLTEKGIDLLPAIVELREWAEKHDPNVEPCAGKISFSGQTREALLQEFKDKLRQEHLVKQ